MAKKAEAAEGTVSKMEAVRQILAAGVEKPKEAVAAIKEKFGIDIPTAIFSSYKSAIAKSAGKTPGKRGRKPRSVGAMAARSAGAENNGVSLARDVKKLVDAHGAAAVKEMADVFAG